MLASQAAHCPDTHVLPLSPLAPRPPPVSSVLCSKATCPRGDLCMHSWLLMETERGCECPRGCTPCLGAGAVGSRPAPLQRPEGGKGQASPVVLVVPRWVSHRHFPGNHPACLAGGVGPARTCPSPAELRGGRMAGPVPTGPNGHLLCTSRGTKPGLARTRRECGWSH